MKIRKFNESVSKLDTEYIDECFIEHIDENKIRFRTEKGTLSYSSDAYIGSTNIKFPYGEDDVFESYRKYYEHVNEVIDSVEECVEKVKIKYPNINFKFKIVGNIMEIKFW